MVLMDKEKAELELKGKSPREIYGHRSPGGKGPGREVRTSFRTLAWVGADG